MEPREVCTHKRGMWLALFISAALASQGCGGQTAMPRRVNTEDEPC